MKFVPCAWDENGKPTLHTFEEGPKHTAKFDVEGYHVDVLEVEKFTVEKIKVTLPKSTQSEIENEND
jgi:Mg2+/Co2+ transporter CorB